MSWWLNEQELICETLLVDNSNSILTCAGFINDINQSLIFHRQYTVSEFCEALHSQHSIVWWSDHIVINWWIESCHESTTITRRGKLTDKVVLQRYNLLWLCTYCMHTDAGERELAIGEHLLVDWLVLRVFWNNDWKVTLCLWTSGNSSLRSCSTYVPRPLPVPPPIEWSTKKHWRQSHCSAAFLNTSNNSSLYLNPYSLWPVAQLFPLPTKKLECWSSFNGRRK